ncbi:hypothetical protein AB0D10_05520 [Kitasatospora sp. NPDC048545]|uniref:hypothetical protein n=1 Tax=Kitasatospora sp. NPDC048545 TaxID=3157208 RepID=UPI0033D10919
MNSRPVYDAATILAVGIVHFCTPGQQIGWPHQIQALLETRDGAAAAERTAVWGSRGYREAFVARIAAEAQLARALDVPARTAEPLDCDPWLMHLTTHPAA